METTDGRNSFCRSNETVWDLALLWNTTIPRFSHCFLVTLPPLVPALFLLLGTPLEVVFKWWPRIQRSRRLLVDPRHDYPGHSLARPIAYNAFNVGRLILVGAAATGNLIELAFHLAYWLMTPTGTHPSTVLGDLWSATCYSLTFVLCGLVLFCHRRYGIHTSGLIWVTSFLLVISSTPSLYMLFRFSGPETIVEPSSAESSIHLPSPPSHWTSFPSLHLLLSFTSRLAFFLLNCFADARPGSNKIADSTVLSNGKTTSSQGKKVSLSFIPLPPPPPSGHSCPSLFQPKRLSIAPDSLQSECPELRASFLSRLTFWWFTPLAIKGYRKSLTLDDLWRLPPEDASSYIAPRVDRNWISQIIKLPDLSLHYDVNAQFPSVENLHLSAAELARIRRRAIQPGVVRTLHDTFGLAFWQGNIFKVLQDLIQFLSPFLLKTFLDFVASPSEPEWHGYFLAALFLLLATLESYCLNYYFFRMYLLGARIQTALVSAIYRKSLQLSNGALRQTTTGEIVNLMSVDAQRFVDMMPFINLIWSAPLRILLLVYFIWRELGPAVFAGVAVMVLLVPLNWYFTAYQRRLQLKQMGKKDERVKVIGEMLTGMRIIKLYGWEESFIAKVSAIRDREIVQLREIAYVNTVSSFLWTCAPFLVSFVTFAVYVLASPENVLTAQKAFVSLSLFNLMQFPLAMLPRTIASVVMLSISVRRLNRFFNSPQLEKYVTREESTTEAVTIEEASFSWEPPTPTAESKVANNYQVDPAPPSPPPAPTPCSQTTHIRSATLAGITLHLKKGSLLAIVGPVGSGKSSLLSAILGDMERLSGRVNVAKDESIAYVAQQAWIRNASLRENILFGSPYERQRYETILELCALQPDLAMLPGGDETEIGEKGINLSGGQKQRVAIARACYADSSLYLFDDPLSAVDSHVARHIFRRVISSSTGYLKDRTRILVTNNIALLPQVDHICTLSNGAICEQGTYAQLMAEKGTFAKYMAEYAQEAMRAEGNCQEGAKEQPEEAEHLSPMKRHKTLSVDGRGGGGGGRGSGPEKRLSTSEHLHKQLIANEHTETGQVKGAVYGHYFRSLTYTWLGLLLLGYVGIQVATMGSNVWLAIWSNDHPPVSEASTITQPSSQANSTLPPEEGLTGDDPHAQRNHRLAIFGLFGLLQGLCVLFASISKEKAMVLSSVTLHRRLLESIMHSPMHFFDTTPLGRIVNRFAKDIENIDYTLPSTVHGWLMTFLQVTFTLLLIIVQVPLFLLVVLPLTVVYYFIQKFYVATSRQLKRLESVSRSPIYSHFAETLSGVASIRAFGSTRCFIGESNYRMDTNQRCYYPSFIDNRWLAIRLEFCGNLVVFFTALFSVLARTAFASSVGLVGLMITYALQITQTLNWLVRQTSEMETNVVSVERIGEYFDIEREQPWHRTLNAQPELEETWPAKGAITFDDYSVRYREGLDLVLKGLDFAIQPGEKVGIVGRTGSGKSTLTLALFRILEAASGRIVIDGIDIAAIGLHELRSKLSIIPQDPVLFSGTIRSNLDPFSVYSDEAIWTALEQCHLGTYLSSQSAGLSYPVAENGVNLSVGQRQLICLGRALLRHSRILVLDEATAAIDLTTDASVQETIKRQFAHCTVLTIAHRLHTIIDSTRVLVLEEGKVVEFDSPQVLLANAESRFYALAKDAGIV